MIPSQKKARAEPEDSDLYAGSSVEQQMRQVTNAENENPFHISRAESLQQVHGVLLEHNTKKAPNIF